MDIEYALAHADAFIRERVITDIHAAIVATLATEVRRLQKIESAALCCDGIDMGDYYQLPVAAFEDLLNSLRSTAACTAVANCPCLI